MSADNWTVCPKCSQTKRKELELAQQSLKEAYGKVSLEEYLTLQERVEILSEDTSVSTSFREDYEQGVYDEEYFVNYIGCCIECGFSHKYEFKQSVL